MTIFKNECRLYERVWFLEFYLRFALGEFEK